jgi:acylphosphatase
MTQHDETETARADATYEPDPRRWRVLAVSLVVGFLSLLYVTIVNVAVPSIRASLETSAATMQWVVSGFALAFGMTLVAGGRLGVVGWVRNEPDGSVLLHAEGEDEAVDALVAWCHEGPGFARVQQVAVREAAPGGATSFAITG